MFALSKSTRRIVCKYKATGETFGVLLVDLNSNNALFKVTYGNNELMCFDKTFLTISLQWKHKNKLMWQSYFFIFKRLKIKRNSDIINEKQCLPLPFSRQTRLYGIPPSPFLQENLDYPFYDFSKISTPIKIRVEGGSHCER